MKGFALTVCYIVNIVKAIYKNILQNVINVQIFTAFNASGGKF